MRQKRKKWWAIVGIVAVTLIAVATLLNLLLSQVDREIQTSLEALASDTLGVPVQIQSLSLDELGGDLQIQNLTVQNPPGFQTPHLMKIDRLNLKLRPFTLWQDIIQINHFSGEQIDINIEQKLTDNNVRRIVDTLTAQDDTQASRDRPQIQEKKGDKKLELHFDEIRLNTVRVNLTLSPLGLTTNSVDLALPNLRLTDVSSDQIETILASELIAQFVRGVFKSVIRDGGENIPELLEDVIAPQLD
ncbi:MAG: AsmA family protein [Limnospira sp.]